MTRVLHIEASPMQEASNSRQVAQAFLDAYAQKNPTHQIETHNIWQMDLPPFDAAMIAAKFAVLRAQNATEEQKQQWARAVSISQAFNRADLFVFSLPMWNFGIPYRLKHYIDVVTLPGQNWMWSRTDGYTALLQNKRAILVYSSAGDYPLDLPLDAENADFQKPYMRQWLRFIGVDVEDEVVVAPTLTDPARLAETKQTCLQAARHLGLSL